MQDNVELQKLVWHSLCLIAVQRTREPSICCTEDYATSGTIRHGFTVLSITSIWPLTYPAWVILRPVRIVHVDVVLHGAMLEPRSSLVSAFSRLKTRSATRGFNVNAQYVQMCVQGFDPDDWPAASRFQQLATADEICELNSTNSIRLNNLSNQEPCTRLLNNGYIRDIMLKRKKDTTLRSFYPVFQHLEKSKSSYGY